LHPPVLVILEAIAVVECGILLFIARTRGLGMDPITWWSISMFIGAGGLLLVIAPAPRFIANDLGIGLVITAAALAFVAARKFAGKSSRWEIAAAGPLLWLLANRVPFVAGDLDAQMTLSWGLGSFYSVAFIVALWPDGVEHLPARPAMLVFAGIHGVAYGLRAILAMTGLDGGNPGLPSNILLIEGMFRVIGTSFLVLALTKQRTELAAAGNLEAARRAGDARRRFVAQMSHEVRTPLNGVFGLAQVLARDPRLLPDQREYVQALEIAGRHLLSIVNDALDLAKIDADRLELVARPFDPARTADDCLALLRPAALDKNIALVLERDPAMPRLVLGDQTRLQQILLNLLANALRFTPDRGSVTLRAAPTSAGVCFDIIDTGPGVPADRQHLLFQDFSQLEPGASEGTGLGLAISARLAERMGGSLRYLPREDCTGSIFRLILPLPDAPAEPCRQPAAAAAGTSPLRLLVADDVQVNRVVLRAMLTSAGHSVTEARGGAEVLDLAARDRFDMILLDLRMPDIDGLEVTARLRAQPGWTAEVPIIGISGDVMPETVQACLAVGMDAVLAKPVEFNVLRNELHRLRTHRHASAPVA
jgi:signal transduction histidine kinase/ActR/RegA family two-component response regulator